MAIAVLFNGIIYSVPETGEESWGESLTDYLTAISTGCLQKSGGAFTLTANVNFGATFGLLSKFYTSTTSNPSSAGSLRLAVTDTIGWRNNSNNANLLLSVDGSDRLTFNGGSLVTSGISQLTGDVTAIGPGSVAATVAKIQGTTVSGTTGSGNVVFSASPTFSGTINASSLTASEAVVTDSSKNLSSLVYTPAATASTLVSRDSNANVALNNVQVGSSIVTASGGTTVLTVASARLQILQGTLNQRFNLPDATTLTAGTVFEFNNNSTGIISIQDAGSNELTVLAAGGYARVSPLSIATSNGVWDIHYLIPSNGSWGNSGASIAGTLGVSSYLRCNNSIENYATTATAAGTTTLLVSSAKNQFFTGATTQNCILPDATTLPQTGFQFFIVNASSGAVTVKDNGGNTIQVMAGDSFGTFTAKSIATANGSWQPSYNVNNAGGGTVTSVAMTVPTALFATSPVSGSPVTTSGTLAPALATQTANTVFAGPASGVAATPTFRALTSADLSSLTPPFGQEFEGRTPTGGPANYAFEISGTGTAAVGDTYTVGGDTFTVLFTISSGAYLIASGPNTPATSGTLTRVTGSGDATLAYSDVNWGYVPSTNPAPLYIFVVVMGAGGGGGSGDTPISLGSNGEDSFFLDAQAGLGIHCGGGTYGSNTGKGGNGGNFLVDGGDYSNIIVASNGGYGASVPIGGTGVVTWFGGQGGGSAGEGGPGDNSISPAGGGNAGGWGAGGGGGVLIASPGGGGGGGGGGFATQIITGPLTAYAIAAGDGGQPELSNIGGTNGGEGFPAIVRVIEFYQ